MSNNIIALSTPHGSGAIAIVRLTGNECIRIVDKFFFSKHKLINVKSHTAQFGQFKNKKNQLIDEVLVTVYKNPKSYTGEDLVEISCHSSNFIVQEIINTFISHGVKMATKGEFTQRAFINGKLDLSQAEAVADLISSESAASHRIAINQLKGGVSDEMTSLRESLINFTAMIELELDFGEEDVEFADRNELYSFIDILQTKIKKLISSFEYGNAIKEGVPVTIIGKPNAGKSTLLNSLLNEERAIVSDIAGTTRDTIEELITIDGIKFRLIDTAGLRDTNSSIEKIGIEKAIEKAFKSKLIIYLYDRMDCTPEEIIRDVTKINRESVEIILVENKIDVNGGFHINEFTKKITEVLFDSNILDTLIAISSIDKNSIESLKSALVNKIKDKVDEDQVIINNSRHLQELKEALIHLNLVREGLDSGLSGDLLSFHLKDAIRNIGSITGGIDVDRDILGAIFSKFCIGK